MAQRPTLDPCRLVRQVKQFGGYRSGELLHLPDKPAGVGSLAKFATLEKKETRMKPGSIHKKISWTPEDRARHQRFVWLAVLLLAGDRQRAERLAVEAV